jgi:hypothetical protein
MAPNSAASNIPVKKTGMRSLIKTIYVLFDASLIRSQLPESRKSGFMAKKISPG